MYKSRRQASDIEGFRVGVFAPSNTAVQLTALRDAMITAGLNPIQIDQLPDDVAGFRKLGLISRKIMVAPGHPRPDITVTKFNWP